MNRFEEISVELAQRQTIPSFILEEKMDERLAHLLLHHWKGSNPSWRVLAETAGLTEENLPRRLQELSRLPLMTRSFLREGGFAERPNAEVFKCVSTTGSTQSAVRLPHNLEMSRASLFDNFLRLFALNAASDILPFYGIAHWVEGAFSGSQATMTFMSESFGADAVMGGVAESFAVHWERVQRIAPRVIASAPGFMTAFANYVLGLGESLSIPYLVVGGSALSISDRRRLEMAFNPGEILHFYPTTDAGGLGSCVGKEGEYQSFSETHMIEVVREDGSHVDEGEVGMVAVTAFDSLATPIIRYLVGDRVTFLGRSAEGNRVRLRDIKRSTDASIGDFKVSLADLEGWRDQLARRNLHTTALQLAKRRDEKGLPYLVIRIEAEDSNAAIEAATLELVRADVQLAYAIDGGFLPLPRVEIYPLGELLKGRFKLPIFVDEMELS